MKYGYKIKLILQSLTRRLTLFATKYILPYPNLESECSSAYETIKNGAPDSKILYIALKYDYGNELRGLSYEEYNFFHTFKNMQNIEIVRFDFYSYCFRYGIDYANQMLKEIAVIEKVNKLIVFLYLDVFDHSLLKDLSSSYGIETIIWLFDDDKRYDSTKLLVNHFDKVVTTMKHRHLMRKQQIQKSYLAQFGSNHHLYCDYQMMRSLDVLFVGQNFGNRSEYINHLKINGINVSSYGSGWSGGRVTQSKMIELFNKAKIVLNFSSSDGHSNLKYLKGRVFEVPPTGALLLTEECEELEDYFNVPFEVDTFSNKEELLAKVVFYLQNESERDQVARSGQAKVLKNYTIENYIKNILI